MSEENYFASYFMKIYGQNPRENSKKLITHEIQRTGWDSPLSPEEPEDLIWHVLKEDRVPKEVRSEIIIACNEIIDSALNYLSSEKRDSDKQQTDYIERVFSIAEISRPIELRPKIRLLIDAIFKRKNESELEEIAYSAVSCLSRNAQESDRKFFEDLLSGKRYGGLAFNSLIGLNPDHLKVNEYFETLWTNRLNNDSKLDMVFFCLGYKHKLSEEKLKSFFKSIKEKNQQLFNDMVQYIKDQYKDYEEDKTIFDLVESV